MQKIGWKIEYLAVTRIDIYFIVSMVSQFLNSPCTRMQFFVFWSVLKVPLEKVCYMVIIITLMLWAIQM